MRHPARAPLRASEIEQVRDVAALNFVLLAVCPRLSVLTHAPA